MVHCYLKILIYLRITNQAIMERYRRDGKWFEREYDEDGILIYDSYDDYDPSREEEKETSSQYFDGFYDPEHRFPVIDETEYDDEGYEVAQWIPTMIKPKSPEELETEKRKQKWVSVFVIIGCLLFIILTVWISYMIVYH